MYKSPITLLVIFATVLAPNLALSRSGENPGGDVKAPANLDHAPAEVRAAILRYGNTDLEQWHYQRTRTTEEGSIVDRHDPTLPGAEHWQLVSIDGREPTRDELETFEDDRADHSDDEEKARTDYIIDVIQPGSIVFQGEIDGAERYGYLLRSPDGKREKTFLRLEGDLSIQTGDDGPWVRTVRVWNTETLRPIIGVRIDQVMMSFHFELQDGYLLPRRVEAQWQGEFLMLKNIDRVVDVSLTDFRLAELPGANDPTGSIHADQSATFSASR